MIKIDSLDKAFAYSVGRLDLETGEIGGEKVDKQLSEMRKYCKLYGRFGDKRQDICPNYIKCHYHPIPSYCEIKITENLISIMNNIMQDDEN